MAGGVSSSRTPTWLRSRRYPWSTDQGGRAISGQCDGEALLYSRIYWIFNTAGAGDLLPIHLSADTRPYRKLNPDVLVVQSAQNWHRQYATE